MTEPTREEAKSSMKAALLVGAIVLVPLVGSVLLYRACSGGSTGDVCKDGTDCKPGSLCVSGACASTCSSDAQCPTGFTCQQFEVKGVMFGDKRTPIGASKACLR